MFGDVVLKPEMVSHFDQRQTSMPSGNPSWAYRFFGAARLHLDKDHLIEDRFKPCYGLNADQ